MKRTDNGRLGIIRALEGTSLLQRMPTDIRRSMLQAALSAGLGLLLAGALFGGINRGLGGAVIGAASGAVLGLVVGGLVGGIMGSVLPQNHARANVTIVLTDTGGRYAPGEMIHGYAQVDAQNSFRVSSGSVYFMCRGFYMNVKSPAGQEPTMDRQTRQYLAQRLDITSAMTLKRGSSTRYPFELTIPQDGLPTHKGYACALRWSIHYVIETPIGQQVACEHEILVEAQPPTMQAARQGYQSTAVDTICQMTLALDRVVASEGTEILATLHLSPIDSFQASEVRLVLVRVENTPVGTNQTFFVSQWEADSGGFQGEARPGGRGTTYVWLEDENVVADNKQFLAAEPESFSGRLCVPAQWRPSIATKDGTVSWKIVAILARAGMEDLQTQHEIVVYSGSLELIQALTGEAANLDRKPVPESAS